MGLIKEPLDVDFVVDPRPLTEKERRMISDFIKADKLKRAKMIDRIRKRQKRRTKAKVS
jgi:DNA primase catalytic subunit